MAWTERQLNAIEKRNTNLLVSAAAGSGKTSVLVERIKGLLTGDGIGIDRMLIVTFTNAASSEMKERIYGMLKDAANSSELDSEKRSFFRHQMNMIGSASICTFDKLAIKIAKKYYHVIGIKPDLGICQGPIQSMLRSEAMNQLFNTLLERRDPDFIWFLDCYSSVKSDSEARSMISDFQVFLQSLPDPGAFLNGIEDGSLFNTERYLEYAKEIALDRLRTALDAFLHARDVLVHEGINKAAFLIDEDIALLTDIFNEYSASGSYEIPSALKAGLTFKRMSVAKDEKTSWDFIKDEFNAIRDGGKKYAKEAAAFISSVTEEALETEKEKLKRPLGLLCRYTREFDRIYCERKAGRGIADFSDIQHYALKILENKEVADELRNEYQCIFIDEYQDSNIIQETLIGRIARENNVFMVGDVKQSIYKFRLAEPELFIDKYDSIKSGKLPMSEVIDLNSNFRSKSGVIEYINGLFEKLMNRESCGIEYDDDAKLYEGSPYEGEGIYTPKLYLVDRKSENPDIDEEIDELGSDELEALNAVRLIKEYHGKVIYDSKKGCCRSIRYSDMAILLRAAKGHGEVYYDTLAKAGIPVYLDRGEGYFDALEIQVFLNLLKIIDNRKRDIPLLSVLRFPSFGFSARELADIRIFSGKDCSYSDAFGNYAAHGSDEILKGKCKDFEERLKRWRLEASYMPLGDFLWKLLSETGVAYFAAAVNGGSQREANLRALADKAQSYESEFSGGLYGFISYIEAINSRGGKVDIGQVKILSDNDDVVRIMTIHKSKGLEFPFVLVAGLGHRLKAVTSLSRVLMHKQFGLSMRLVNPKTGKYAEPQSYKLIASRQDDEEMAESIRLLYVAMTRAKDVLLLSGTAGDASAFLSKAALDSAQSGGCKSYLEMLVKALGRGKVDIVSRDVLSSDPSNSHKEFTELGSVLSKGFDGVSEGIYSEIERRMGYDYAPVGGENEKRKYSVSQIAEEARGEVSTRVLATEDKEEAVTEEMLLKGAAKGTAYHTVMEHISFNQEDKSAEKIAEFIDTLKEKRILTESEASSVDPERIRAFFESDLGRRACRSDELHKEAPFVLRHNHRGRDVLVQGVIDCYFREGNEYVLLDYKSNYIDKSNIELELKRMEDTYIPQLALYREALETIKGIKVKEAALYLFSADKELKLKMPETDMHLHTIYSDGQDSPEEMVDRAKSLGYKTIAITDHDGAGGVKAAVSYGRKNGIKVIPGIELSAEMSTTLGEYPENRYFMHILGYGIDVDYKPLADKLERVLEKRAFRNNQIIEAFKARGIEITQQELAENTPNLFIGKVSFARVLQRRGYVASIDEAFKSADYLGRPEIKSIRKDKISADEAIELIHGAGGKVFFAHPYQLSYVNKKDDSEEIFLRKLKLMLYKFREMGLDGIECGYPTHTKEQMQYVLGIADELGLLCSRGSDDHGAGVRALKEMGEMQAEISPERLNYIGKLW